MANSFSTCARRMLRNELIALLNIQPAIASAKGPRRPYILRLVAGPTRGGQKEQRRIHKRQDQCTQHAMQG